MAERPTCCIFCGGTPRSKEHVWAAWLGNYLPALDGRAAHTVTRGSRGKSLSVQAGAWDGSNHGHSQKLKVVCHPCNNGWMSLLQVRAKPFLEPMTKAEFPHLTAALYDALAAWATMFAMVAEYADEKTVAITESERFFFKENCRPPPNWKIWLGSYGNGDRSVLNHHGISLRLSPDSSEVPNTQTTTFTVGRCVFHSFSTSSGFPYDHDGFEGRHGLVRIWPDRSVPPGPIRHHDYRSLIAFSNEAAVRLGVAALNSPRR